MRTRAAALYGDFARGRVWREDDLDLASLEQPPAAADPYTAGKREAERVLWRRERSRVPFTIVRPGYVVGPHDHNERIQFFVRRFEDGGPFVLPSGACEVFQLAWHADVAAAMARVTGNPAEFGRAYNLAGREIFTYPTLVRALGAAAGVKTACVEVPRAALRRGALAAEELPFGEDGSMWVCDIGRLERELGVEPTPAAAWMPELVRAGPAARDLLRTAELSLARRLLRAFPGAFPRIGPRHSGRR